jgi:hypothetical protein
VGDANVDGVVWKVEPGLGMVVHLVDEADHPLPGGRAQLVFPESRDGSPRPSMPLEMDADGRYDVTATLYPGTYSLQPYGGYDGKSTDVELREGMGKVDATLRLRGHGSILVTVQTPQGDPVDD